MKVQKIFILTASFFIHAVGMELQMTHSGEQELDLNAFIDKMYQCKNNSTDFIELSKQCSDEYKSSLINYFAEKASTGRYNREDELNSYKWNKNFDNVLEKIVRFNKKKHVKYNIAYSNAWRCIALLRKDLGIEGYEDEWSQWKTFADLMKNDITAQKTMKDICSFFSRESNVDNFTDIYNDVHVRGNIVTVELIKAAAQVQNMSVLTLLLCGKYEAVEGDKIDRYIYDTLIDKEREILVKVDNWFSVQNSFMRAVEEKAIDKAWSFLRIYIAQGHHRLNKYAALLKHMLEANLPDMVDMLLQEGLGATKETIKTLTCDQIKTYVVRGHAICGAKFWDNEAHKIILHKAVQENNKEFVEYLLSLDAPTNVVDGDFKTSILYSLNNDEIFNILVKFPPRVREERAGSEHELFYYPQASSNPMNCLKLFIQNNPEEKIIQLFKENFFSIKDVSVWLECAIELNKYDLFVFLFGTLKNHELYDELLCKAIMHTNHPALHFLLMKDKNVFLMNDYGPLLVRFDSDELIERFQIYQENISEEQQQKLVSCAIQKERYGFARYLLKQELGVDQLKFIESVNQHRNNNEILCSLLNEAILEKNEEKVNVVLQQLEKHIKNITREQADLLLKSALEVDNSTIIDFLINNECVSIRDMQDYMSQMQPGYNITLHDQFSITVERRIEEDEQNVQINEIVDGVNQCTEELEHNGQGVENKEVIDGQEKEDNIVPVSVQHEVTISQHVIVEQIINKQQENTTQITPANEENKEIVRSEVEVSTDGGLWYVLYGIKNCFLWGIWFFSAPIRWLASLIF